MKTMLDEAEREREYEKQIRRRIQFAVFAFVFVSGLLREAGVNAAKSWIGVGSVAVLLVYWISPRPRESFLRWTLIFEGYLLGIVAVGYLLPLSLKAVVPGPLAFGFPIFLLSLAFYFMPRNPIYRKQSNLGKWALRSLIVAAVMGFTLSVLPSAG